MAARRIVVSKNQKFDLISKLYLRIYTYATIPGTKLLMSLRSNGAFLRKKCGRRGGRSADKEIVKELE